MRFEDAVAELNARQPEHMPEPGLERIRELVKYLDDPQLTFPTIHVAGTNGKSTTARVVTTLACGHEIATGLYTSPHLRSVRERLMICDETISEREFAQEWEHLAPFLELVDGAGMGPVTYFEAVTALSFLWFADKPIGLGVIEVGMGGGWDATNVVSGEVAVICEIGLDHPELGSTIADVAGEKAGVLKHGTTAVIREQRPEAMAVIEARAAEVGATLLIEGRDWAMEGRMSGVGGQVLRVRGRHATYEDLFLPIFGVYAARNAAAGIVALEASLEQELEAETTRDALREVRSPGRLDVRSRKPLVVLDGAHNPAGAAALAAALAETFTWERLHLVMAVSANKDLEGLVRTLAPLADVAYATANDSVRSASAEDVARAWGARGGPPGGGGGGGGVGDPRRTGAQAPKIPRFCDTPRRGRPLGCA